MHSGNFAGRDYKGGDHNNGFAIQADAFCQGNCAPAILLRPLSILESPGNKFGLHITVKWSRIQKILP